MQAESCAHCADLSLFAGSRLTRSQGFLLLALQLLLGIGLISSKSSYDPFLSSSALSSWIAAVGLWGAFVTGLQLNQHWDKAAKAFVAIIFVVTVHALGLFITQGAYLKGTFTNPDCFSVLPLAAAFVSLGLLSAAKPKERIFFWFLFPWFCSVVALTGSRSGLAGLAVGFSVFAALAWKKIGPSQWFRGPWPCLAWLWWG